MKSLHFCTSEAWGGLELYACTLMAELRDAGVGVAAVCAPGSKCEEFLRERGIATHHLPGKSPLGLLRSARFVRSLIDAKSIGTLHVHFHSDIWPAALSLGKSDAARKLLLSIYMGVPEKNDLFHRLVYRRVDAIFTSSPELCRRLPSLYPVPAAKVHLLPYGRSLGQYRIDPSRREAMRARYGFSDSDIVVGTMVRIDPGKGVMDFAESISYIDPAFRPRVKYLIIGEPTRRSRRRRGTRGGRQEASPFEPRCEAYLGEIESFIRRQRCEETIRLAGYEPDVVGALSAMDIFVFPSRDELYSLVVLDAMALALPVVAARAGGNLFQIEEGTNGLLYRVGESRDLALMLMHYLKSPDLRRRHGDAARRFVEERHSMARTIDQLLSFYS